MSDYELIRNVIAGNNQALDDRRYEDCVATFAEGGTIAGHQGRAAILDFMHGQGLGAQPDQQRRHVVTNIAIEISATRPAWPVICCSTTSRRSTMGVVCRGRLRQQARPPTQRIPAVR